MNEAPQEAGNSAQRPESLRFKIGLFFLIVNTPFGYGGGALAGIIGANTGHPALGAILGTVIYITSWIMLGLGIWLAGPAGLQIVRDLRRRLFGGKKRPPGTA